MNIRSSPKRTGLIILSALLVIFGVFVLVINITLLYKGTSAVEKGQQVKVMNSLEKANTLQRKEIRKQQPKVGQEIGKLFIPKLNISIPIFHGTTENELQKGVGHVIGTALFGESNNTVLSGHRDTVFKHLGEITKGDHLKIEDTFSIYTYKVRKIRIVEEDDLTVIVPKPRATLTVSTCYPFTYIGPAKKRYVLVADLINSKLKRI